MQIEHPFLLNFSASYSGGGYKRLSAYCDWFGRHGGAWFAIHPRCEHLVEEFPGNEYFIIRQSHLKRLYDDWSYLDAIRKRIGRPELYYAYGIPLYRRLGEINWSHLQNVLLVGHHDVTLSPLLRAKLDLLGWRYRRGFARADVISAESQYSLDLLASAGWHNSFLSINGSDDELASLGGKATGERDNIATVVGTIGYKSVSDAYLVFKMLQQSSPDLRLAVIGDRNWVPRKLRSRPDVILRGLLEPRAVIECLRRSRFFICASQAENSFNCAAEGAFLAAESYISDIPPHAELFAGEAGERVRVAGLGRAMLHTHAESLRGINLRSWNSVILAMVSRAEQALRARRAEPTLGGAAQPAADSTGAGSVSAR